MKKRQGKSISVNFLARVEGEGGLMVKIQGGQVTEARLNIFEPPRFFEAFLRGRKFNEAPDITARICGICPVAYQMSSINAMENLMGVQVERSIRELRRLLYFGEWIESHALHIFLLHAPDFLGLPDALAMAKDHGPLVEKALRLKKIGNSIINLLGGREIHPINVRVGGFFKVLTRARLQSLISELSWARDFSIEAVHWTSQLHFPDFEMPYEYVALQHPEEYAILDGRLVSTSGLNIEAQDYENYFVEEQVPHSHALHSTLKDRGQYFVGPLARFNLNFDRLCAAAKKAAKNAKIEPPCRNPFKSIMVRAIETLHACDESLGIIEHYEPPARAASDIRVGPGTGYGCTEAPRGILYHRYDLDSNGIILNAKIVPPTSQNQKTMENDLLHFVQKNLALPKEQLTWRCEQAIRNYDPCISCATHFLKLSVVENPEE
ncbi:MAG: Ni/Fe hydrogenase subunit alpha [Acidobacteriia bacterium]|nr:Ni/Fe hydrogenase subunit alpha [Terriglobia bacterium]